MEPFIKSVIILLAINNLTIMGVGGQWNLAWVLMTALACVPVRATSVITERALSRAKLGIVNSRFKMGVYEKHKNRHQYARWAATANRYEP